MLLTQKINNIPNKISQGGGFFGGPGANPSESKSCGQNINKILKKTHNLVNPKNAPYFKTYLDGNASKNSTITLIQGFDTGTQKTLSGSYLFSMRGDAGVASSTPPHQARGLGSPLLEETLAAKASTFCSCLLL